MTEPCCPPLLDGALDEGDAIELAAVFKALADPVRVRLLSIIASSGEACACDLPALVGRSQPTVSHHLSLLTDAGLLEREQRGKWAWFCVNPARVSDVAASLCGGGPPLSRSCSAGPHNVPGSGRG